MLEDLLENRILSYIRQRALAKNQGMVMIWRQMGKIVVILRHVGDDNAFKKFVRCLSTNVFDDVIWSQMMVN